MKDAFSELSKTNDSIRNHKASFSSPVPTYDEELVDLESMCDYEMHKNEFASLTNQQKMFAIHLSENPNSPFDCAVKVFEGDRDSALDVYMVWMGNSEVHAFMRYHLAIRDRAIYSRAGLLSSLSKSDKEDDELTSIPSAETIALDAYSLSKDASLKPDDRLKALKQVADIGGYIKKPEAVVSAVTNVTNNRVMIVKDYGSDAEWEEKLAAQQAKLISDGRKADIEIECNAKVVE